jgi:TPR repeat protein
MYFYEGRGVKRNISAARRWYGVAASLGHAGATRMLESLGGEE